MADKIPEVTISLEVVEFMGYPLKLMVMDEEGQKALHRVVIDLDKTDLKLVRRYLQERHGLSSLLAAQLIGEWFSQAARIRRSKSQAGEIGPASPGEQKPDPPPPPPCNCSCHRNPNMVCYVPCCSRYGEQL